MNEDEMVILGEMTRDDARNRIKKCDVAILPVGSCEQHGPHLPLDTDTFDAYWLAKEVAMQTKPPKPIVCPPLYYGVSYHHMDYPGTISIMPNTLMDITYEICSSMLKHGIRKILIINGHGGNTAALTCTAQRIHNETGALICIDSGGIIASDVKKLFKTKNDVHAGEYETSTSLFNREIGVRIDKIQKPKLNFISERFQFEGKRVVPFRYMTKEISDTGVLGDPTKADKKKGARIWKIYIRALVKVVDDLKKAKVNLHAI